MDKPNLGLATTRELLNEITARIEVDGKLDYRTVGDLAPGGQVEFTAPEQPERELPKDKRVVRTKSTGDRVYLIDETAKTKAWVTSPEILAKLGFELSDVQDVEDSQMLGYAMTASVYRVEE